MKQKLSTLAIITVLGLAVNNCAAFSSLSTSSQSLDSVSNSVSTLLASVSKSVGSLSKSSKSSAEDEKAAHYSRDVEILVSLYTQEDAMGQEMEEDLNRLAGKNGILDWRQERTTYTAIGSGLKLAGYSRSQVEELVAKSCPKKPELQDAILEGYGI